MKAAPSAVDRPRARSTCPWSASADHCAGVGVAQWRTWMDIACLLFRVLCIVSASPLLSSYLVGLLAGKESWGEIAACFTCAAAAAICR